MHHNKLTLKRFTLIHTRFVDAQTHAFSALADMPIKFRNVLLPALTPTLQEAMATTTRLRQIQHIEDPAAEIIEELALDVNCNLQTLIHGFEMALRLKALPEGRVAIVIESLVKALP